MKLFPTGFYGIAKTVGMLTFTFVVVEKIGRRKRLIWGAFLGDIGGYFIRADPAGAAARGDIY